MIRLTIVSICLLFLGCSSVNPVEEVTLTPLSGYQIMENPRSKVTLGAKWINDIGTNGNGVPEEEIDRVSGIESYIYTSSANASVTAQLARFFGISGAAVNQTKFILKGIETYRVKDIFTTNITAGESILYEAIKVRTIYIEQVQGANAGIEAQLRAKGIPFEVGAAVNGGERVVIDGSNLFLAFRVVTFIPLDYGSSNVLVDGNANDIFISSNGYRIRGDAQPIHDCACVQGIHFSECLKQPITLKITEPSGVSVGGLPAETTISHKPSLDWDKNYILWKRTEKELSTGTVYRTRYLSLDFRRLMAVEHLPQECVVQIMPGGSAGEIVEAYYELRALVQPRGW